MILLNLIHPIIYAYYVFKNKFLIRTNICLKQFLKIHTKIIYFRFNFFSYPRKRNITDVDIDVVIAVNVSKRNAFTFIINGWLITNNGLYFTNYRSFFLHMNTSIYQIIYILIKLFHSVEL